MKLFQKSVSIESLDFFEQRERYLPYRAAVLLEQITDGTEDSVRRDWQRFADRLAGRFHHESFHTLKRLRNAYTPLDPDRDTLAEPLLSDEQRREAVVQIVENISDTLRACNFVRLSEDRLNRCLALRPVGGLVVRIDTGQFSIFRVCYRGARFSETAYPKWQLWRRGKTRREITLKKVFVLAVEKEPNDSQVLLKLFRDVPVENLKIVAPNITLGLPVLDQIKIGGTVLGGLAASAAKLVMAAAFSWWLFSLFLFGFILALAKGVFGFFNSRTKYLHICSKSLYYRNLSNNVGAITSLVTLAEEQEMKETLLAFFALQTAPDRAMTEAQIDRFIERWLLERFKFDVDFEVDDALRKLREKRLAAETESIGADGEKTVLYRAVELRRAVETLDEDWKRLYAEE